MHEFVIKLPDSKEHYQPPSKILVVLHPQTLEGLVQDRVGVRVRVRKPLRTAKEPALVLKK